MITGIPKDFRDYCEGVAKQADEWLVSNPKALERFRGRIKPWADRWHQYLLAPREHRERVKVNPALRNKAIQPPGEDWEWRPDFMADPHGDLPKEIRCTTPDGIEHAELLQPQRYSVPYRTMPAEWVETYIAVQRKRIDQCEHRLAELGIDEQPWRTCPAAGTKREPRPTCLAASRIVFIEAQLSGLNAKQRKVTWPVVFSDWWEDCGISREQAYGCWCPKALRTDRDPREELLPKMPDLSSGWPDGFVLQLPNLGSEELNLQRFFAVLAVIHDLLLPYANQIITEEACPEHIRSTVEYMLTKGQPHGPDKTFIDTALRHVQADLQKAEQEPTGADPGKRNGAARRRAESGTGNATGSIPVRRDNTIELPKECKPMTTAGLAAIFGCSARTILRRIESSELPATRDGRRWRVPISCLPAEYVQKAIQK